MKTTMKTTMKMTDPTSDDGQTTTMKMTGPGEDTGPASGSQETLYDIPRPRIPLKKRSPANDPFLEEGTQPSEGPGSGSRASPTSPAHSIPLRTRHRPNDQEEDQDEEPQPQEPQASWCNLIRRCHKLCFIGMLLMLIVISIIIGSSPHNRRSDNDVGQATMMKML